MQTNKPFGAALRGIAVTENTLVATSLSAWLMGYDLVARRERWRVDVRSSGTSFAPAIGAGSAYAIQADGRLAAASIDGGLRWLRGDLSNAYIGQPFVASDRLFVSGKTGFWALSR